MEYHERFEPNVDRTKPSIKGTRVTLNMVFDKLAGGYPIDEILLSFPEITRDDVSACLHFGSELATEAYTERMKKAQILAARIRKLKFKP